MPALRDCLDLDQRSRRIIAVARFRADPHVPCFSRVGAGNQPPLHDIVRLEPGSVRTRRHGPLAGGFVIPAPEYEPPGPDGLRDQGFDYVPAARTPVEGCRGRHALPVDSDLQTRGVRRDRGHCRSHSVQPGHSIDVSGRQLCAADGNSRWNRLDASVVHDRGVVVEPSGRSVRRVRG